MTDQETQQQAYSAALGRILDREAKVSSLDELKALVDAGRKAMEQNPTDPQALTQLQEQHEQEKAQWEQERAQFRNERLSQALSSLYLELGGIPNSGETKVQDSALKLLLSSGEFELDDSHQLVAQKGTDPKERLEAWLKENPVFARNALSKTPGKPSPATRLNSSPNSPFAGLSKWF